MRSGIYTCDVCERRAPWGKTWRWVRIPSRFETGWPPVLPAVFCSTECHGLDVRSWEGQPVLSDPPPLGRAARRARVLIVWLSEPARIVHESLDCGHIIHDPGKHAVERECVACRYFKEGDVTCPVCQCEAPIARPAS